MYFDNATNVKYFTNDEPVAQRICSHILNIKIKINKIFILS